MCGASEVGECSPRKGGEGHCRWCGQTEHGLEVEETLQLGAREGAGMAGGGSRGVDGWPGWRRKGLKGQAKECGLSPGGRGRGVRR